MKKILLNGVSYEGVDLIYVPTEDGGVTCFYNRVEDIPQLSVLDENLLVYENKGKIYGCGGKLYKIEEVYIPSENGDAFFLEDGKMIAPTVSGDYSVGPLIINGGGNNSYIHIRVPMTDMDGNQPVFEYNSPHNSRWWMTDNFFNANGKRGYVQFPTNTMIETDGYLTYDSKADFLDVLKWARESGKPMYSRTLAFMRVDMPYEVEVLSHVYAIPENEGKCFIWRGELYRIDKLGSTIFFKQLTATPIDDLRIYVNPELFTGGEKYDVTDYAQVTLIKVTSS